MLLPLPLVDKVAPALGDELPLLARDGGFVRQGYDIALDDLRGLEDESRRLIVALRSVMSMKLASNR